jgi:hypothetical protein
MVGTTDAVPSDVTQPGQPVSSTQNASAPQRHANRQIESNEASGRTVPPQASSAPAQFPTAKAVPEKAGYVFSPFASDRYVDVSGYAPGTKVKDPWTDKIFIVP